MWQLYYVAYLKKGKWKLQSWKVNFKTAKNDFENISVIKKNIKTSNEQIDDLFSFWNEKQFLNLSNDMLNRNEVSNDSTHVFLRITDGCTDEFSFNYKGKQRFQHTYEPEFKLEFLNSHGVENIDLEIYIDCRNRFMKLIEK